MRFALLLETRVVAAVTYLAMRLVQLIPASIATAAMITVVDTIAVRTRENGFQSLPLSRQCLKGQAGSDRFFDE